MFSEVSEDYLNSLYDNLLREQQTLMNQMKSSPDKPDHTKQISLMNSICLSVIRLRNMRKVVSSSE